MKQANKQIDKQIKQSEVRKHELNKKKQRRTFKFRSDHIISYTSC